MGSKPDVDAVSVHLVLTKAEYDLLELLLAKAARVDFEPHNARHAAYFLGRKLFGDERMPNWENR